MVTVQCKHYAICLNIVADSANKAISQAPQLAIDTFVYRQLYRSGVPSLFDLKEVAFSLDLNFLFKKFSPLLETFIDSIGQLISAGVTDYWFRALSYEKDKIADIGPQVLTMEHLGLGFIACLIPLVLTTILFLMELVAHALSRKWKKPSLTKPHRSRQLPKLNRQAALKKQSILKSRLHREKVTQKVSKIFEINQNLL